MAGLFRTRNPWQDARESSMLNAPTAPPPPVIPTRITAETAGLNIEARRRREQAAAAEVRPSPTLADEAVRCLRALLVAVDDQEAGRPLSPTANQALGDLARLLKVAEARGVGLSSEFTVRAG